MAQVEISAHFNTRQQVFLNFVLSQYVKVGVEELDRDKLAPLLKLKYNSATIADGVADLGRPEEIGHVLPASKNTSTSPVRDHRLFQLPSRRLFNHLKPTIARSPYAHWLS